ncbi:hypothetical protein BKK80_34950 (plasmid) [Cupriavidus malaysiensis]|uniref:2-dehydro-3-deoxygalactonokinase n=2 Tax=Cupriavidus malaysiensis TaxID=367825 RepID=A0ABM6FGS2_9BURK|nr:hypothetical protein BKK80_34950 [Cupriavidus malaysiensis]
MHEIIAVDWGTTIVGVMNVLTGSYIAYRDGDQAAGARRVLDATGTIVSFNGTDCDLPRLYELLGLDQDSHVLKATHDDMRLITSSIRWPCDPGTIPIYGHNLRATYEHFCGPLPPSPPEPIPDKYELDNWNDCYRTAELWKRWKQGTLVKRT